MLNLIPFMQLITIKNKKFLIALATTLCHLNGNQGNYCSENYHRGQLNHTDPGPFPDFI